MGNPRLILYVSNHAPVTQANRLREASTFAVKYTPSGAFRPAWAIVRDVADTLEREPPRYPRDQLGIMWWNIQGHVRQGNDWVQKLDMRERIIAAGKDADYDKLTVQLLRCWRWVSVQYWYTGVFVGDQKDPTATGGTVPIDWWESLPSRVHFNLEGPLRANCTPIFDTLALAKANSFEKRVAQCSMHYGCESFPDKTNPWLAGCPALQIIGPAPEGHPWHDPPSDPTIIPADADAFNGSCLGWEHRQKAEWMVLDNSAPTDKIPHGDYSALVRYRAAIDKFGLSPVINWEHARVMDQAAFPLTRQGGIVSGAD